MPAAHPFLFPPRSTTEARQVGASKEESCPPQIEPRPRFLSGSGIMPLLSGLRARMHECGYLWKFGRRCMWPPGAVQLTFDLPHLVSWGLGGGRPLSCARRSAADRRRPGCILTDVAGGSDLRLDPAGATRAATRQGAAGDIFYLGESAAGTMRQGRR